MQAIVGLETIHPLALFLVWRHFSRQVWTKRHSGHVVTFQEARWSGAIWTVMTSGG